MRLLVDGDAVGHRDFLAALACERHVPLVWVHDASHNPPDSRPGLDLEAHLADGGSQSVDVAIMNLAAPGDIVVTADLGLAVVCVAKGAAVISPRGFWYRPEELERRMEFRALAARLRRGGAGLDGKPSRRRLDDWRFEVELGQALQA